MKFCKNLQRIMEISNPEWTPYWPNYKMLKKLIKELPSLVPTEFEGVGRIAYRRKQPRRPESPSETSSVHSLATSSTGSPLSHYQQHDDGIQQTIEPKSPLPLPSIAPFSPTTAKLTDADEVSRSVALEQRKEELGRNPGEIAFFKLLHAELKKASHFFDKAQQEYLIREERVREGIDIMKQPNSIMVNDKWTLLSRSCYRLYKDLLLLETFAIMTYCSFSKILKKHDKVTGYQTRTAFMENVVNKVNFTNYPLVLEMIGRCEQLYEQVSERLVQEGKDGLYEDERLFINMINRLNEQVLNMEPERKESHRAGLCRPPSQIDFPTAPSGSGLRTEESASLSTLRSLVAENDAVANAAHVSEGHEGVDTGDLNRKPSASKKQRIE